MNQQLVEQKESFIEQELQKFNVVESKLKQLAEAGKGLTIASIDDKKGLEAVKSARIAIKNERVRIEKAGKGLRDQANAFNKSVLAKEKEYLAIIVPTEDALQAEENKIENERKRIEQEKEDAKQKKIQLRISQLASYGHVIDFSLVSGMTDEVFESRLLEAKDEHEAEVKKLEEQKEATRIEQERLAKVAAQQEAERQKMIKEREEFEIEQRKAKEIKEAAYQDMELEKEKMRLKEQALEDERNRAKKEDELRIELEKKHAADLLAAQEDARKKAEQEIADQKERERLAEIETKRQASLAPDKDKLIKLSASIDLLELPELSMPEAEKVLSSVKELLGKVSAYIQQQVVKL